MKIHKIVLSCGVAALVAGCCNFGGACYVPVAQQNVAWDGLVVPSETGGPGEPAAMSRRVARQPDDGDITGSAAASPRPKKQTSRAEPKPFSPEWQAREKAVEDELKQKIVICKDCLSEGGPQADIKIGRKAAPRANREPVPARQQPDGATP